MELQIRTIKAAVNGPFQCEITILNNDEERLFHFHENFCHLVNATYNILQNRFEHILTLTGQLVNLKGDFKDRIQLSQMQENTDPVIILTDKTMTPLSKVP